MRAGWTLGFLFLAVQSSVAQKVELKPCPRSPNCVSSLEEDPAQRVEPISFSGDAQATWERIVAVINDLERVKVITRTDSYLHAEIRSSLFHFVDDLELQLDPDHQRIEVRSASRTGHSDLGVNRKRVEQIRAAFSASSATTDAALAPATP